MRISNPKIKKFLPFIIVFVLVVFLLTRQKNSPLPPPQVEVIPPDKRSAENTEFTLPDLSGNATRLSDFKGNVVLLNFFATWCPPCREEMPMLEELFLAYQHKNFVVLGVANDSQGKTVVAPFVKTYKLTFPVVLDADRGVSLKYRVRGIPVTYVLDRQGKIVGRYEGAADWDSKEAHTLIEQLLQEHT